MEITIISLIATAIFALIGLVWSSNNKRHQDQEEKNKQQDCKIEANAKAHSEIQLVTQEAILRLENKFDTGMTAMQGELRLISEQMKNFSNNGKH